MVTKNEQRKIFTVSRLNQEVQQILESGFGLLWLQGELSNFSRPASGHFYFTLKDSQSQIRCAMFRGRNRYVDFKPENGEAVLVRGKLGLYSARGDFQLIVEHMEPAGEGQLRQAFEERKRKLEQLGWFDQESKQAIPTLPNTIGVVTSPTGAAIKDVLHVLARRYPQATVIVYPCQVQGEAAAPAISAAIAKANKRAECDVLLVVRGGGSLEDLWAFNEEAVAKAIKESELPIIAGVGHEVDITIADLVADLRAPTPSAAAELATPDTSTLGKRLAQAKQTLVFHMRNQLEHLSNNLGGSNARLQARHPQRQIEIKQQRVDELATRLQQSTLRKQTNRAQSLQQLARQLRAHSPDHLLSHYRLHVNQLSVLLETHTQQRLAELKSRHAISARALHTVSPLATLDRGFAVVRHQDKLVTNATQLKAGDTITTRLAKGEVSSTVDTVKSK